MAYRTSQKKSRRISRQGHAFTLVETMAAVVIIAIAIPPLLWALGNGFYQRVNPVMASKARFLVTEKLEDIIADRHSTTRGYEYVLAGNYPTENPVSGYAGFTRTVTVSETEADLTTPGTGYKRVTVVVSWTDASGTVRSLSVDTVVTDY